MKKKSTDNPIPADVLAAYLDGNATATESQRILDALSDDPALRELIHISQSVDAELGISPQTIEFIPMTAMAATCPEEKYCCLECEKYILDQHEIRYDEQELLRKAGQNKWQKAEGTALYNIGRHLEDSGLIVTRQYNCNITDILHALNTGEDVIVAVDEKKLTGNRNKEHEKEFGLEQMPDHTVVVLSCDTKLNTITIHDPNSTAAEDHYTIGQFAEAWADSKNYLVTASPKGMKIYIPKPIDISDVELTDDLNELQEAIAENAHEIWAASRQEEGWTYGKERNDRLKQTPDMVPYSQLPDSEKEYDREMAMKTIKLLKKLGYDLVKYKHTTLYQVLKQRLKNADEDYHCPKCGNVIYKYQKFCDNCGLELNKDRKQE